MTQDYGKISWVTQSKITLLDASMCSGYDMLAFHFRESETSQWTYRLQDYFWFPKILKAIFIKFFVPFWKDETSQSDLFHYKYLPIKTNKQKQPGISFLKTHSKNHTGRDSHCALVLPSSPPNPWGFCVSREGQHIGELIHSTNFRKKTKVDFLIAMKCSFILLCFSMASVPQVTL